MGIEQAGSGSDPAGTGRSGDGRLRAAVIVSIAASVTLATLWLTPLPQVPTEALLAGWLATIAACVLQRSPAAIGEYAFLLFLSCAAGGSWLLLANDDSSTLLAAIASLSVMAGLLAAPIDQRRSLRALALIAAATLAALGIERLGVRLGSTQATLVLWFSAIALAGILLRARRERRERQQLARMEQLAMLDPLTGLMNRRSAFARIEQDLVRGAREGRPVAIAMLDLDGFKAVNDAHGHDAGDRVLVQVAELLRGVRQEARPHVVARIGGDEFVAAWYGVGEPKAWVFADQLRQRILELRRTDLPALSSIDVSIGVAVQRPGAVDSLPALLRRADQLMYDIKRRRQVGIAGAAA